MISSGIQVIDLQAGLSYNYYTHPVPFTMEMHYIGGPFDEVIVAYFCSKCGDYGIQDIGSKKFLEITLDRLSNFSRFFQFTSTFSLE